MSTGAERAERRWLLAFGIAGVTTYFLSFVPSSAAEKKKEVGWHCEGTKPVFGWSRQCCRPPCPVSLFPLPVSISTVVSLVDGEGYSCVWARTGG